MSRGEKRRLAWLLRGPSQTAHRQPGRHRAPSLARPSALSAALARRGPAAHARRLGAITVPLLVLAVLVPPGRLADLDRGTPRRGEAASLTIASAAFGDVPLGTNTSQEVPQFDAVPLAEGVPAAMDPSGDLAGALWPQVGTMTGAVGVGSGGFGLVGEIPLRAYQAYRQAEASIAASVPGCHLPWALLAGIGRVESDHGRHGGSTVGLDGRVTPPIIGIRLDGSRSARIGDSDDGRLDGDRSFDRAVGPMQFLPGTWARWGVDGDDDGVADPQDLDDAALTAGRYLCGGGADVSTFDGARAAVFRYNRSDSYVAMVLGLASRYAGLSSGPGVPPVVIRPPVVVPPATPPVTRPPVTAPPTVRPTPTRTTRPTGSPTGKPTRTPSAPPTTSPTTTGTPPTSPSTTSPDPTTPRPSTSRPDPTCRPVPTPTPTRTGAPTPTPSRTASRCCPPVPTATVSPTATRTPSPTGTATVPPRCVRATVSPTP